MKQRPALADPQQEAGIDLGGFTGAIAHLDLDAGCAQPGVACAAHPWVGILECRDDPCHPGCNQGIGAGRRAAMVGTGLERDEDRSALEREPGRLRDRLSLGVRTAAFPSAPTRQHGAVAHDHAADGGIGPGPAQ